MAYWSFDHQVSENDALHYGVKGMKWGKRNSGIISGVNKFIPREKKKIDKPYSPTPSPTPIKKDLEPEIDINRKDVAKSVGVIMSRVMHKKLKDIGISVSVSKKKRKTREKRRRS